MRDHDERLALAHETLQGLSVGDALGEALSYRFYDARNNQDFTVFSNGSLRYTDDTEMALAIVECLRLTRTISEDTLAWAYSLRYKKDPDRGYGRMARRILDEIGAGADWEETSRNAFNGGSFGNGSAMRVAPLGAYFADDIDQVPAMAAKSARVTHYHPEGIAGAVATATAAAAATQSRGQSPKEATNGIWDSVLEHTDSGAVRDRLLQAQKLQSAEPSIVAVEVGNGAEISAQDTVPFCIWNACRCIDNYKEAILSTIEVGGDCDTNCAIVGGIVASYTGQDAIPSEWLRVREQLPL